MGAISFSADRQLLQFFHQRLPITTFVETGTYQGASLAVAAEFFNECHSVELLPESYASACRRFAGCRNIKLYQGESCATLATHREQFAARPVLFWLDAHWCAGEVTAGQDSQCPLQQELQAIGKLHPQSVVLIDDARLFLCPPPKPHRFTDWPDIHDIARWLLSLGRHHRLMVFNDVIIFYPEGIQADMAAFAHRQGVDWLEVAGNSRKLKSQRPSLMRQPRKWLLHVFKLRKKQAA